MVNHEKTFDTYKRVREDIDGNDNIGSYSAREEECKRIYSEIIKNEPAIMEWEVEYWGRCGQWGMPLFWCFMIIFLPFSFIIPVTGNLSENYPYFIFAGLTVSFPLVIFILAAEWFPVRYYQKITATGFYSYGVKAGRERRKKMAQYCMIGGFTIALILLFVAGPMVFAGAGAASLSFLKLGSIPETEPEESAWPWLGIYCLLIKKPFLYRLYKVQTQGDNHLILTSDQIEEVKKIITSYNYHELSVIFKEEDWFHDHWWNVRDKMPFYDENQ